MENEIEYRALIANDINIYRKIRIDCLQNYPNNFGTLLENEVKAKTLKFDKVLLQENSQSFLYGAFKKEELINFSNKLNFIKYKIQWKWAFRYQWIISKI